MPASFVYPVFLGGTLAPINHHPCENNIQNGFVEPERLNLDAHLNVMNLDLSSKHELERDNLC